jgi:hypothetical protein
MPDTDTRSAAGWRLGAPAVLMVAFAVAGLFSMAGRSRVEPRQEPAARVETAPKVRPTPPATYSRTPEFAALDGAPAHRDALTSEGEQVGTEPALSRVPEELRPAAPDVTVGISEPTLEEVAAHAHVPVGLDEAAPLPDGPTGATSPGGDDIQGPEPGAWYWFGPTGLERLRVLAEASR